MKTRGSFFLYTFLLFFSASAWAKNEFEQWLDRQERISWDRLKANIHPEGTVPGVVIASPSRQDPDYFFHWVRDAALVMDVIAGGGDFALMDRFIRFSRGNQLAPALTGLGEPKFHVDGSPFDGPWGRPQNDGPALRALTLTRYARTLLRSGQKEYVLQHLYRPEIPAHTVIKADLEFVAHHWRATCFDLWEEVKGHHFYTRLAQYQALLEGSDLALLLNDTGAADFYRRQAFALATELRKHFDSSRGLILNTLNRDEGLHYKDSNLDTAVVLAVLHARSQFVPVDDPFLKNTVEALEREFHRIYAVNHKGFPATAIGRYPEDRYYGGNPWFLTTAALAEYYYLRGHLAQGDAYMARIKIHLPENGAMDEQIDRDSGYMLSARDLTWSYASFITAVEARKRAVGSRHPAEASAVEIF